MDANCYNRLFNVFLLTLHRWIDKKFSLIELMKLSRNIFVIFNSGSYKCHSLFLRMINENYRLVIEDSKKEDNLSLFFDIKL